MALDKQLASVDPGAVFSAPEDVLDNMDLTALEKREILRRWAYDVAEMAVAVEEGMPEAGSNDLQHRIFLALGTLPGDLGETGPTKQHGLAAASTRKQTRDGDGAKGT